MVGFELFTFGSVKDLFPPADGFRSDFAELIGVDVV